MRIAEVVPIASERFLFVRVRAEDGTTGVGEAGAWAHLPATAAAIETFGAYLVGQDARRIELHWNVMHRSGHFRGAAITGAISAIDMALWDLKGKRLGVPVWELLGGSYRERVRVYGHAKGATADEMVRRCLALRERGFTAFGHLNPFLDEDRRVPYFKPQRRKLIDAIEVVRAVREAVGDDVDICLDVHRRLPPAEALALAEGVASAHPMFLEDPIRPDTVEAMVDLARRSPVPIATGERFTSIHEFEALLARRGAGYVRPCLALCGGITAGRKIAAIAEAHDVQLVPHTPLSPVSLAACVHLAAAVPNVAIQEYPNSGEGWDLEHPMTLRGHDLVDGELTLEDGFLRVPDRPGLGVELRIGPGERTADPRPIRMRRHADGSVVDQ